jgi:hypothetical protein
VQHLSSPAFREPEYASRVLRPDPAQPNQNSISISGFLVHATNSAIQSFLLAPVACGSINWEADSHSAG